MESFRLWLFLLESGRLDHDGFNDLFRQQLRALLPRISDPRRRASLERMQDTDWVNYILTALRNAGIRDEGEREEAANDIAVYLLVQPGNLFSGYDPTSSGPMEARFTLAVRNAVRNHLRSRGRRSRRFRDGHADAVLAAVPDRRRDPPEDVLAMFRVFLRQEIGDEAVQLLDRRLDDGLSLRQLAREPAFRHLGDWGVRQMMRRIRDAAVAFARSHADEDLLRAIARLTQDSGAEDPQDSQRTRV
jgi:hypothetical protein